MGKHTRRRFLKTSGMLAGSGLVGLAGCLGGIGGGTPTINFQYVVPIESLASLQGIKELQDALPNYGEEYELEITSASSTPNAVTSMASGNNDAAMLSTVSFANAIEEEAVQSGLTTIMTDFYDAYPDYYGATVFSPPDSDITEPEDLAGAKCGINALGTATHAVYTKMFQVAGVDPDDVEFVEIPFPATGQALRDGRVDTGLFPPLFASRPRAEGFTKVFSSHDAWADPYPLAFVAARNDSLDNKEDAFRAWGADCVDFFEYVNSNRSEVISLAAEHFEIPEPAVDAFYLTEHDYYRDLYTDVELFDTNLNGLAELGYLQEQRNWAEYATNDYLE